MENGPVQQKSIRPTRGVEYAEVAPTVAPLHQPTMDESIPPLARIPKSGRPNRDRYPLVCLLMLQAPEPICPPSPNNRESRSAHRSTRGWRDAPRSGHGPSLSMLPMTTGSRIIRSKRETVRKQHRGSVVPFKQQRLFVVVFG